MKSFASISLVLALAACGGGGEHAGPVDLRVVPDKAEVTGSTGICASGEINTFYVYGGEPPYTVKSTVPQGLTVSTAVVDKDGGSFVASVTGICLDKVQLVIQDREGRLITAEVTNKKGS
jgi:hypothetical protein